MTNSPKSRETPLVKTVADIMRFLRAFMVVVLVGYFFSGVTVIAPNEAAVILRMGKIVGAAKAAQVLEPGWAFALPKPFDKVVRIPVKQIQQIKITELSVLASSSVKATIDPVKEGYCISADKNIFQATVLVKYRISDAVAVLKNFSEDFNETIKKLINDLTVSALTAVSVRFSIDGVLTQDKERLSLNVLSEVQKRLTHMNAGVSVLSLEFEELSPPAYLKDDFEQVNEAFINKHNFISEAQSLSEEKIPTARGKAKELVMNAKTYKETTLADATAKTSRFKQLLSAYLGNKTEIRQEMVNKARKTVFGRAKHILTFPSLKDCKAAIKTVINAKSDGDFSTMPSSELLYEDSEPIAAE